MRKLDQQCESIISTSLSLYHSLPNSRGIPPSAARNTTKWSGAASRRLEGEYPCLDLDIVHETGTCPEEMQAQYLASWRGKTYTAFFAQDHSFKIPSMYASVNGLDPLANLCANQFE